MNSTPARGRGQRSAPEGGLIRFTRGRTCPVCGGCESNRRGQGQRCHGFISGDSIHCTREEHAGKCEFHAGSGTYSHSAKGACPCGEEHGPALYRPERPKKKEFDRAYQYKDLAGNVVHETVRYKNPKDFGQRRPSGNRRYIYKDVFDGITPILYRLSELCAADPGQTVFIVEGEKDVERLMGLGLVATTNPMGAGKWHLVDATPLNGRPCVLVADNDDKGRKHCQEAAVERHGKALSVKLLELPGLPEKGDVSDWLNQGGTVEQLLALAAAAPTWSPDPSYGPRPSTNGNGTHSPTQGGSRSYEALRALSDEDLGIARASSIPMKAIKWLWEYRLAAGEFAMMAGEPGLGKSQVMLAIAAAITNGSEWPGRTGMAPIGSVIILSAEDDPKTTIVPRLHALGANLDNVVILRAKAIRKREGKPAEILPMSFQDLDWWKVVFERTPDALMLIADPIVSYLGKGVNDQRNTEIREILEPFIDVIIRPAGACFLGNTHLNKAIDSKSPLNRISGSTAYGALPRNVHFVVKDPDNPKQRYLKQCKSNNAPDDLEAIPFKLEKRELVVGDLEVETSVPVFADKGVDLDLQRVLGGDKGKRGPRPVKTNDVAEWLFERLKDSPLMMRDLVEQAQEAGHIQSPSERHPNPSITILYDASGRIPTLHPGWRIEESRVEAGVGVGKKPRKRWALIQAHDGEAPSDGPAF